MDLWKVRPSEGRTEISFSGWRRRRRFVFDGMFNFVGVLPPAKSDSFHFYRRIGSRTRQSILMRSSFALVIAISVRQSVTAYVPIISSPVSSSPHTTSSRLKLVDRDDDENEGTIEEKTFRIPNPLAELGDILSNWDDVVDDFFNKRVSE